MAAVTSSDQWPVKPLELASGIDTLIVSLRGELPESFGVMLSDAKAAAVDLQEPKEVTLGGVTWQLQPGRFGRYPYNLAHEFGFLGVTDSKSLPTLRWQPRAEALHAFGPSNIVLWLIAQAEADLGPVTCTISRMDLHADFQGVDFRPEDKESFICRARSCMANWDEGIFSGFTFGSRRSKSVFARLYDKSLEITKKGGTYWYEIWGSAFEPDEVVWRIEFELHRAFLRKFGVNTLEQGLSSVDGLWKYATEEWLSLRTPTLDETHSRWPIAPDWQAVRNASLALGATTLERVREARIEDELHRAIPQLNGWLARVGAILDRKSSDEVLDALPGLIGMYERMTHTKFDDRIDRKRRKMLLP